MTLKNFELNLDTILASNPFFTVGLGDFNVKSNLCCKSDKTYEGSKIEGITSQFGLQQLISEPTHHTKNSPSCFDLIFASQPNSVMESGVHSSLHRNCHHEIIYAKFKVKIYYPPPYERGNTALSKSKHRKYQKSDRSISMDSVFYKY